MKETFVPGENLTRKEAQKRSRVVTTRHYDIALDLSEVKTSDTFRSTTRVTFVAEPDSSTFIDAITDTVHRVELNGEQLDLSRVVDGPRIMLDTLRASNELVVDADFRYQNTGEGLHRFVDPVDDEIYLYTQFEVPDSRRVFAVFEQPDLKATFQFTVTAPSHWQVVSNQPTPEPEKDGEVATWRFGSTPRISSYITALIAGPYEVVRNELTNSQGRVVPLGVFARKSLSQFLDADYIFDITKKGFEYFERRFGVAYPFEKYDQLFVPEFNAGAMENAGAVTFTEAYVFRSQVSDAVRERRVVTILHELAHMWFGDLVTMRWWNDLWLNESFAEWASTIATAEATEWTEAWTTFQAMEKSWAYRQDQLPSTHPIVATINDLEDVQVNFDGITYAKGGSVLKQLVAWVGEDAFFSGVSSYFKKHAWDNTELSDLLNELEVTSGRDLSGWSKLWLETAGVNTLRPLVDIHPDGTISRFAIHQSAPEDWPTLRPHRLAVGFYDLEGDEVLRTFRLECDIDGATTEIPDLVGMKRPGLILINDDDLAYAKIRLDDDSTTFSRLHLKQISSPLARSLVWGAAWDQTRDAEMSATDFRDMVLGNIAWETESTTVRTLLAQLHTATTLYSSPATRSAVHDHVATMVWELAQGAAAGSDSQFQLVKSFAQLANTDTHAAILADLKNGKISLAGLAIDTDLGWELLAGLVLTGHAGEDAIADALSLDNTSNGQQHAARLRAMIPTLDAKKAVVDELLTNDSLPNAIVRHMTMGYTHVNDPELLAPNIDRYFNALGQVWESRTYKMAEYIIDGLFPSPLVTDELVQACQRWLDGNPEIPALRRLIEENQAGVVRALHAQEKDSHASV
jgi:aminopeptidase N